MPNVETPFDSGLTLGRRNAPEFFTYSNVDSDGAFQADAITSATSGTIYKSPPIISLDWEHTIAQWSEVIGSGRRWVGGYGEEMFTLRAEVYNHDVTFLRQAFGKEKWRIGFWIPDKGGFRPIKLHLCFMSMTGSIGMAAGSAHKRTITITPMILESATADATGELGQYGSTSAVVTAIPTFSGLTDVI